jgi:DNA-directed RNA polymerase subunit RPC12/RpoP
LKITFACPQCAKPLVADVALAGRTGRCRHCGHRAVVPNGQPPSGGPGPAARAPGADWRAAVASQLPVSTPRGVAAGRAEAMPALDTTDVYSLRPVTPIGVPALAASDWDNAELGPAIASPPTVFTSPTQAGAKPSRGDGKQPRVATKSSRVAMPTEAASPPSADFFAALKNSVTLLANRVTPVANSFALGTTPAVPSGASPILVAYRLFFGLLGRVTTWISETSYTVSFILIILAVASGMVGRHALATTVCGVIVALNLVGLAGDIVSLVTLSFRKNPLQGGLFLIPPFTLYYLWTDWYRYRDTVLRMRIPLITLALVVAAYLSVPWLRGGIKNELPAVASVEQAVDRVEEKLGSEKGVLDEGLKKARSWLREVPLPNPPSMPGSHGTHQPAHGGKP